MLIAFSFLLLESFDEKKYIFYCTSASLNLESERITVAQRREVLITRDSGTSRNVKINHGMSLDPLHKGSELKKKIGLLEAAFGRL